MQYVVLSRICSRSKSPRENLTLQISAHMPKHAQTHQAFCRRVLRKQKLLIHFEGKFVPLVDPEPRVNETYAAWTKRLYGGESCNVALYVPSVPKPQTRMSTLQRHSNTKYIEKMVSEIAKQKDVQRQDAVNSAVRNTERIQRDFLTNFIDDLIAGGDLALEDSVRQFLTRLLERINTDEQPHERAIRDLVGAYNAAVSQHRSGTAQGLGPSEYVRLEE